jgi:transcriptional regulator with XRE-family HTH domain
MSVDYKDIGGRIRAARKKQSLSQEKLAEMVDVGVTHISHIETGNTKPSIKTLVAIINALDVSADELFRNHLRKAKHVLEGELAEIIHNCTDDEARIITDTAKALKDSLRRNANH